MRTPSERGHAVAPPGRERRHGHPGRRTEALRPDKEALRPRDPASHPGRCGREKRPNPGRWAEWPRGRRHARRGSGWCALPRPSGADARRASCTSARPLWTRRRRAGTRAARARPGASVRGPRRPRRRDTRARCLRPPPCREGGDVKVQGRAAKHARRAANCGDATRRSPPRWAGCGDAGVPRWTRSGDAIQTLRDRASARAVRALHAPVLRTAMRTCHGALRDASPPP